MANEPPLSAAEVLASEYRALRPDSGFAPPADVHDPSLSGLFRKVHEEATPLSALCISGGGIRSATFALGAVQGLAEHGLLDRFDYLSTVSGGGYLGGWLTAWIHRAGGIDRVVPHLRRDAPEPARGQADPIRHLREYNSYLSPRRGGFSADVWTLVATVARNILLNWLVLIPLLLLALLPPRLYVSLLSFPEMLHGNAVFAGGEPDYAVPALDSISGSIWVRYALPALSAFLFAMAWYNLLRFLPGVGNRNHTRAGYLKWVLAPLIGAVLTFLAWDSLFFLGTHFLDETEVDWVIEWTLAPVAAAWLVYLATHGGSLRSRFRLLFGPLSLALLSMAAGIGVATWATTNYLIWSPNDQNHISWDGYVTFGPALVLLGFYLGTALFLGLSSSFLKDEDREWMSRAMAGVLLFCVAWTGLCVLVLLVPGWVAGWRPWENGVLGLLGAASAWLSSRAGRQTPGSADAASPGFFDRLLPLALKLAPAVFLAVVAIGLSLATDQLLIVLHGLIIRFYRFTGAQPRALDGAPINWEDHYSVLTRSQPLPLLALVLLLLAVGWFMARYVNINTFSLHGMYRERLIRAYLGASNPERRASQFTGFAADDNIPMGSLDPRRRPFHVLNLTLNLVGSSRLDWQQRKAQPFTVSPLACGNADLGYRPSAAYGGDRGISLGTAIAISGAAASPAMGSFSSPAVGFILTLFNARLGAWLGNPGPAGGKTWHHSGPRAAIRALFKEALGLTTNESEYVYLSDGGHFENFGLYEMVRRRCRTIVVLDGGADPKLTFDDLGNALRKIRIDLRIPIDFDDDSALRARELRVRCAVAAIRYSAVDGPVPDGRLLYFKPLLRGNEPPDVASYGRAHPEFPHQSTANQWFDEAQTESYRQLGLHTVDEIARGWKGGTLEDFARHVETVYLAADSLPGEASPG
jgi:hypothetical protein